MIHPLALATDCASKQEPGPHVPQQGGSTSAPTWLHIFGRASPLHRWASVCYLVCLCPGCLAVPCLAPNCVAALLVGVRPLRSSGSGHGAVGGASHLVHLVHHKALQSCWCSALHSPTPLMAERLYAPPSPAIRVGVPPC